MLLPARFLSFANVPYEFHLYIISPDNVSINYIAFMFMLHRSFPREHAALEGSRNWLLHQDKLIAFAHF